MNSLKSAQIKGIESDLPRSYMPIHGVAPDLQTDLQTHSSEAAIGSGAGLRLSFSLWFSLRNLIAVMGVFMTRHNRDNPVSQPSHREVPFDVLSTGTSSHTSDCVSCRFLPFNLATLADGFRQPTGASQPLLTRRSNVAVGYGVERRPAKPRYLSFTNVRNQVGS